MLGGFGLLAPGLLYMVPRCLYGERQWSDRASVWALWLYNIGFAVDSGESRWTVDEAIALDVPSPVITL